MANPIRIKRGLKASIPTLAAGELAMTTDTFELFGGTGSVNKFLGGPTVMANPMTAVSDIIYGGTAGLPTRLAKGTAYQALGMNSGATLPVWVPSLQSVLTTAGDILYASSARTPARLAKGTAQQVLRMNAGATAPEWAAPAGGGKVAQVTKSFNSAKGSTTVIIPCDNTIPQNGEGAEIITCAITPTNASSTLIIDVFLPMLDAAAIIALTLALFRDSTANAVNASMYLVPAAAYTSPHSFRHVIPAGSTNETTFKVRGGGNTGATIYWNQRSDGTNHGGTCIASMTITEVLP